ncbi:MAG: DNA internalization-related competence protein ComEC/Rec2 [Armatimonadota bacterium]|nr:DNA internalization-related competence protein ComEC/Rec2 [Armatimonadota bacterium]MDW8156812.1 DNA internalization-related competence protein ComEC/Rec2 [Armatimonadota bacterium]
MHARRPLLWTSVAFVAGSAAGVYQVLPPWPAFGAAVGLVLVAAWAAGRARLAGAVLLACAAAAGAAVGGAAHTGPRADELAGLGGRLVEVEGFAATSGARFVLDATHVLQPAGTRPSRVGVRGRTQVAVGDRVRVRGRLLPLPEATNPGQSDPSRWLHRHGARAVVAAERVWVVGRGGPWWQRWPESARTALQEVYRRALGPPLDSLLAGAVLGVPVRDQELQEAFRRSGLVHLLVASGAQLSTVAASSYLLLRRLRRPFRVAGALAAVLAFAWVAGWEPSMARAAIMAGVAVAAGLLRREVDPPTLLAFAAAVLVAVRPLWLADVGFQLSFAATAALVWLAPSLEDALRVKSRLVREGLAAAVACQLFVAPLVVWHFGELQVWAVVANVLALPVSALVVPAGLLGGVVGLVWLPAAVPVLWVAAAGCAYLAWLARWVSALPGATAYAPDPKALALVLGLCGSLAVAAWRGRMRPGRAAVLAAVAAAVAVWVRALPPPPYAEVVFLDVGQGDAVVARGPNGERLVVDGGPEAEPLLGFLARSGGKLDVAVLSHPHADHVAGLLHAVRRFGARVVLDSGYPHPTPVYAEFLRTVREGGIPYRLARRGVRVSLGRLELRVLWPPSELWEGPSGANENSVVALLQYGEVRFLLPGDVEAGAEASLVSSGENLRAHVLKVPHQGSRTSSSEPFLKAVAPQVAVLSVGRWNPYGHPHQDVLARYARAGIALYRTDRDGAVTIRTDGRALWVQATKRAWCCTGW